MLPGIGGNALCEYMLPSVRGENWREATAVTGKEAWLRLFGQFVHSDKILSWSIMITVVLSGTAIQDIVFNRGTAGPPPPPMSTMPASGCQGCLSQTIQVSG